jgi:hypothetical protein
MPPWILAYVSFAFAIFQAAASRDDCPDWAAPLRLDYAFQITALMLSFWILVPVWWYRTHRVFSGPDADGLYREGKIIGFNVLFWIFFALPATLMATIGVEGGPSIGLLLIPNLIVLSVGTLGFLGKMQDDPEEVCDEPAKYFCVTFFLACVWSSFVLVEHKLRAMDPDAEAGDQGLPWSLTLIPLYVLDAFLVPLALLPLREGDAGAEPASFLIAPLSLFFPLVAFEILLAVESVPAVVKVSPFWGTALAFLAWWFLGGLVRAVWRSVVTPVVDWCAGVRARRRAEALARAERARHRAKDESQDEARPGGGSVALPVSTGRVEALRAAAPAGGAPAGGAPAGGAPAGGAGSPGGSPPLAADPAGGNAPGLSPGGPAPGGRTAGLRRATSSRTQLSQMTDGEVAATARRFSELVDALRDAATVAAARDAIRALHEAVRAQRLLKTHANKRALIAVSREKRRDCADVWTKPVARDFGALLREMTTVHTLLSGIGEAFNIMNFKTSGGEKS